MRRHLALLAVLAILGSGVALGATPTPASAGGPYNCHIGFLGSTYETYAYCSGGPYWAWAHCGLGTGTSYGAEEWNGGVSVAFCYRGVVTFGWAA